MSQKIHRQRGDTVYFAPYKRANTSICGRWIEDCKEIDDVADEIKQRVADENGYEEYGFCLVGELIRHPDVKKMLCKTCFKEVL
jgi:hypothetical protein